MKINVNYRFRNVEGKEQRETEFERDKNDILIRDKHGNLIEKVGRLFTLKSACLNVLTNPPREVDERGRAKENTAEHNLMLGELAREIYKSKDGLVDLSADDIKLLKGYVNKRFNQQPLIVIQAWEVFDLTDVGKKLKKK